MSLHLTTRTDLSLLDLLRIHERGGHVLKTPHVGNLYPNNLVIASLGIPILCVDRTIGFRDGNFHPHRVVHNGKAVTVAEAHKLTTHARVTTAHPRFSEYFPLGGSVVDGHMRALRAAFPSAPIETQTECFRRYGERTLKFFEVLTRLFPRTWERFVHTDGTVDRRLLIRGWDQVSIEGIHGVNPQVDAGWIVPNQWAILWDIVIAGMSGVTEAYELSGPDMVHYVGKLAQGLERAYAVVRAEFADWKLPEHMTCCVVPVADMRLAVSEDQQGALERLVEACQRFQGLSHEWSSRIQEQEGVARSEEIGRVTQERTRENDLLCEAALAVPGIFYQIEQADFLSQYDLLTGTRLFIHPWGLETKISEVGRMMSHLISMKARRERGGQRRQRRRISSSGPLPRPYADRW